MRIQRVVSGIGLFLAGALWGSERVLAACSIAITNPAESTYVSATSTAVKVQGTAAASIGGNLTWSNAWTGGSGTIAAASAWSIASIPVAMGTNVITVSGSETTASSTIAADNGTNTT